MSVVSPTAGSHYAPNSAVPLQASAGDDQGVVSVVANWTRFGYTSQYPLSQSSPGTWSLSLTVGAAGTRTFTLTATDTAGHQTTSAPISISVQ